MFYLHQSNKIELLLDDLIKNIQPEQVNVLSTETILVQNPGIKRWLQLQISQNQGIAANLEFPLPTRFIWFMYQCLFEAPDLSEYEPGVLRWRIFERLEKLQSEAGFSSIRRYLEDDSSDIKRYQLSRRVAALFDSYLIYRPLLIHQWEKGQTGKSADERWQALLWRDLSLPKATPHRAQLMQKLKSCLQQQSPDLQGLPNRLHIFGISAIAPAYLDILNELSQHMPVYLYLFNPCRYYWGDLEDKKTRIKRNIPGSNNLIAENLLASLGQQGKEFIDLIYDLDNPPHEIDNFQPIVNDSLLAQVQNDLLDLNERDETKPKPEFDDDSIQLHSCYSPVRELQVLHDNLLQMFESDAELKPHDIVIMCPDINPLAPYIHAVFGQQQASRQLPYNISDQNSLAESPLIQLVLESLLINTSRLSSNQLLGWLALPALQRKYNIDSGQLDIIRHWVAENGILWGLNKTHRSHLGFEKDDLNSWQFGIDRLLAAYCLGPEAEMLADVVPSTMVLSSEELKLIGSLQKLLDELKRWMLIISKPCALSEWQSRINQFIDNNLVLDENDEINLKTLRGETADWRLQAQFADFDLPLNQQLIHNLLQDSLQQFNNQHQYLSGGITICNLIPMRNIPFKVVCLLGMSDAQFPRKQEKISFDLIQRYPVKGDRSRREDDRFMFLQSVLSARQKLYISYVGHSQKDNSERQLSVVVSELLEYIESNYQTSPMLTEHPLQAFSKRNFDRGSYADLWYAPQSDEAHDIKSTAFNQILDESRLESDIRLSQLISFYKNPAKYFLQNRLNLRLSPYDDILPDQEQFEPGGLERYQLQQQLLVYCLKQQTPNKKEINQQKILRSGSLPASNLGLLQLSVQQQLVDQFVEELHQHFPSLQQQTFSVDSKLGEMRITGQIESLLADSLLSIRIGKLTGKYLLEFWIQHILLSLSGQIKCSYFFVADNKTGQINVLKFTCPEQQAAQEIVVSFIQLFQQGQQSALPFYPDAGLIFCKESVLKQTEWTIAKSKLIQKWNNSFQPMFESQDEYNCKVIGQSDPFPQEFMEIAEQILQPVFDYHIEGKI